MRGMSPEALDMPRQARRGRDLAIPGHERNYSLTRGASIYDLVLSRSSSATLILCLAAIPCGAVTVDKAVVAQTVDEQACVVPKAKTTFDSTAREAFLWFSVNRLHAGQELNVQWTAPDGEIALQADYRELPSVNALCLVTRLPIAGFDAAGRPGLWRAAIRSGGRALAVREFRISGGTVGGSLSVRSAQWRAAENGVEVIVNGTAFTTDSVVHLAQYTRTGGWRYIASAPGRLTSATELTAQYGPLTAAEYLIIVRTAAGEISRPVSLVIPIRGYKLPTVAGEPWVLTQGPYGTFSHWGRSLHAYDIAPRSGRCIVAMRAGIVHTNDAGLQQDHRRRTFGNYITIDHGDGEYSHYAHLASGTFVVSEGQHVEQGQALATVGNSGYTLGEGGGYHVHVHVTRSPLISAPSVPFQFDDLRGTVRGQMTVVSLNASSLCDCLRRQPFAATGAVGTGVGRARAETHVPEQFRAALSVGQWWNDTVMVPKRAKEFEAVLNWQAADSDLDLHLVSPSGRHYGWYGDTTGYSGSRTKPQQFHIAHPEPGIWRIAVQAVRGGPGQVEFAVSSSGVKPVRVAGLR